MAMFSIREAKEQLPQLVDAACDGEPIVIAKAGRPIAKIVRADAAPAPVRLGFLAGQATIPDDFNVRGRDDIADMF